MKALLFEVDKCVKCRACVVACKRNWGKNSPQSGLTGLPLASRGDAEKIDADNPIVVKAQSYVDRAPFVRYSCWHCDSPPCAARCPFKAIKKDPDTGAVYIKQVGVGGGDTEYCRPNDTACNRQCVTDCGRGGYPRIGEGDGTNTKAYKCMLCYGRLLKGNELANSSGATKVGDIPACAQACPAGAVKFGDEAIVEGYVAVKGYTYKTAYNGAVIWASTRKWFSPPTADPFVEDHISPMLDSLLKSPVGRAVVIPALLVGGLYALYARRISIASEAK